MTKFNNDIVVGFEDGGISIFEFAQNQGLKLKNFNRHYSK